MVLNMLIVDIFYFLFSTGKDLVNITHSFVIKAISVTSMIIKLVSLLDGERTSESYL
jgi:hypothetical protein